jgi:hypothetical protein
MRSGRSRRKRRSPRRERERGCAGAYSRLSADTVGMGRPAVPLPSHVLGLCGRSDRPAWRLGGRVDGRCANLSLSPVRRLGLRSAAGGPPAERALGGAVEIRSVAHAPVAAVAEPIGAKLGEFGEPLRVLRGLDPRIQARSVMINSAAQSTDPVRPGCTGRARA